MAKNALLIEKTQEKCRTFVDKIHQGLWLGATGKPIKHIVNVGIGGSCTGPMAATFALKEWKQTDLQFHFISSIDQAHIHDVLQHIDPETTLFIISSKSFATLETLTNMRFLFSFITRELGIAALSHHFIAVTAAKDKALALGFDDDRIFPLWEWEGRYSVWSAISLPLMLMIGCTHFDAFLAGAYESDLHFRQTPFKQNIPVLMAMFGIWYMNFFEARAHAIVPYSHRLRYLIPYLQQAEMESNGKSVDIDGKPLTYATSPILFGEEGVIGQHAYHQLLLQGQHFIPVDFILIKQLSSLPHPAHQGPLSLQAHELHHHILTASALSQAEALMRGKTHHEAQQDLLSLHQKAGEADKLAAHLSVSGNKPSSILTLDRLTPKNLGALLALYEHKIFVQGIIWHINSFDQWGVELGKKLLPPLLKQIQNHHTSDDQKRNSAQTEPPLCEK